MDLKSTVDNLDIYEKLVLPRYMYRVGDPVMEDYEYDSLVEIAKSDPRCAELLNRTYDDDPIPHDLLERLGIEAAVPDGAVAIQSALNDDKSLSIHAVRGFVEAWEFFKAYAQLGKDLVMSIKVDGVNSKTAYVDGKLSVSLSRGRHAVTCFDYTPGLQHVLPTNVKFGDHVVYAEVFAEPNWLEAARAKYGKSDVTPKSTALSMLRVPRDLEDYRHVHAIAFAAEGLADTLTGTWELLEQYGFETPHYAKIPAECIPKDYDSFVGWLMPIMECFAKTRDTIPSDGIVVEVNDLLWVGNISGQYTDRQIALKFGPWDHAISEGIVTDIVCQQRRVAKCVKVHIEPMKTSDGSNAFCINCFNPSILFKENIQVGSRIYFERNSGAVNILVHGKRLEGLKGE